MCQALRELMSDEIDKEVAEGRAEERTTTVVDDIKKMIKNLKLTAAQAMLALEIPDSDQPKYMALL